MCDVLERGLANLCINAIPMRIRHRAGPHSSTREATSEATH